MATTTLHKSKKKLNPIPSAFPVVAIGTSGGGLHAVKKILNNLSADTGMAYVLIQHPDSTHERPLTSILNKQTSMDVKEVTGNIQVEPNSVYIIPPGKDMVILNDHLTLLPGKSQLHMPIDKFFISLADVKGEKAIGVVLSGAAADGTLGLKAIKKAGGLTIAQDETGKFKGTPKSAIAEGVVDMVLNPKNIAGQLIKIGKHPLAKKNMEDSSHLGHESYEQVHGIFHELKKNKEADFNFYKPATIHKRMVRRILILNQPTFKAYSEYLKQNPDELNLLYEDLLTHVADNDGHTMVDEKKDDFIICVSHELKAPLTTAKIYMQLLNDLLKNEGSDKAILYAKNTTTCIEKINSLLIRLLDVTKLQHGKMTLNITAFDFETLLKETINFIKVSSPGYTIVITGNAGVRINADYECLQQVITNLLSNAVKYSPFSNEIEINVSNTDDELTVAVIDNGIGIQQNHLLNIFEKFYREEDRSVSFPGLGVGLFISAEIIKRHNGRIWAESVVGKGSEFYFTIPLNNL